MHPQQRILYSEMGKNYIIYQLKLMNLGKTLLPYLDAVFPLNSR